MDDETKAHLDAMEARIGARFDTVMTPINDNQEKLIERMRAVETSVSLLTELGRGTNTLLSIIASTITDLTRRVTDIEKRSGT